MPINDLLSGGQLLIGKNFVFSLPHHKSVITAANLFCNGQKNLLLAKPPETRATSSSLQRNVTVECQGQSDSTTSPSQLARCAHTAILQV